MSKKLGKFLIVIFDVRGVVQPHQTGTFARHQGYAKLLNSRLPNSSLRIFSSGRKDLSLSPSNGFIYDEIKANSRFSFRYIKKCIRTLGEEKVIPSVFVAGDPWESCLSAFVVQKYFVLKNKIRIPIQIQIHADITDKKWKNASIINRIRFQCAKLTFLRADQIRCVSYRSRDEISEQFNIKKEKILVIPVELNIPSHSKLEHYSHRPRKIGFAGRIHRDRGLNDFTSFIKGISMQDKNLKLVVAGGGSEALNFVSELEILVGKENVSYLGALEQDRMMNFWSSIGVFVTTANSESYGRSMREAALFGIPVIGLESRGLDGLLELGIPWIFKMNMQDLANFPIEKLNSIIDMETNNLGLKKLAPESKSNLENLIGSWVGLSCSSS